MSGLDGVIAAALTDTTVSGRTRAMFGLKADGSVRARTALEQVLSADASALVRHEAAYLLGQLGDFRAHEALERCLRDAREDAMVRHEAAEAMGAIGDMRAQPLLREFADDATAPREVRETCELSLARIDWLSSGGVRGADASFNSVDPAPAAAGRVESLARELADASLPLAKRYRAMFGLRNAGGDAAVEALGRALADEGAGALFRHEVAFVLGQMQSEMSVDALAKSLARADESEMVRHEAAEALGSIGSEQSRRVLEKFRDDQSEVVRESVAVALDIDVYNASSEFQYAATKEGGGGG